MTESRTLSYKPSNNCFGFVEEVDITIYHPRYPNADGVDKENYILQVDNNSPDSYGGEEVEMDRKTLLKLIDMLSEFAKEK